MKNHAIPILTAIAAVLMAALFSVFLLILGGGAASDPPDEPAPAYILREYRGKLGVFRPGAGKPEELLDLPLSLLPPYDQAALREGVPVADEAALTRALEDYTS